MKPPTKRRYTITEAAKVLKVTRAAVHRAIKQGRLEAERGEVVRVVTTTVKGWLVSQKSLSDYRVSSLHQWVGKKIAPRLTVFVYRTKSLILEGPMKRSAFYFGTWLCGLLGVLFAVSGCALHQQQEAIKHLKDCVLVAGCNQGEARQAVVDSGYRHMDLVDLTLAYRKALVERVDKGEVSMAEAELLWAELMTRVVSEEQTRNMRAAQVQLQAAQNFNQTMNQINNQAQTNRLIRALNAPRPMTPITCQPFGSMIHCQ